MTRKNYIKNLLIKRFERGYLHKTKNYEENNIDVEELLFEIMEEELKIKDIKYDEEFEKELDDWEYESRFKSYITVDTTLLEKRWDKRRVTKKVKILKQYARRAEEEGIDLSNILEMALFDKFELYSDNDKKNELSINSNDNVKE